MEDHFCTMDDLKISNGEVNSTAFYGFADKVRRDWAKASFPSTIVTREKSDLLTLHVDSDLNCRVPNDQSVRNWTFTIQTSGKYLQNVALMPGPHQNNFFVKSVWEENVMNAGYLSGKEWYRFDKKITNENNSDSAKDKIEDKIKYVVTVSFVAREHGTYRQRIIFGFGSYPVFLEEICVDCIPADEINRLNDATEYQLSQNSDRWTEKDMKIQRFTSTFIPNKDPREDDLEKIYPHPEKNNFFLTHSTLTEDRLTPVNYQGRLHELVAVEELSRHEQISRYNETSQIRLLSHYILTSSGDGSTVAKYPASGELFAQLPLGRNISEDTKSGRLFLRGCNKLLIKVLNRDVGKIYEAHIEDKCTQTIYARLSACCVKELELKPDTEIQVQVQFLLSRLPFCEWHRAIDNLLDVNLLFPNCHLMKNQMPSIVDLLEMNSVDCQRNWEWLINHRHLNTSQKRAVIIMSAPKIAVIPPPILLLGPFGTGKTFTVAQAIYALLLRNTDYRILLCTHSNSAADLYVKEFFDGWCKSENGERLRPVRIYYKGRARNTVHPIVRDYCLMDQHGFFRDPKEEDLQGRRIVVTTLASSNSLTSLNFVPTHIIVDEAAQALECEVLIPLSLADRETRLIFAGDQMQLAPEIYSDLASERGLGISLLERIYGMYPEDHPCRIHLKQNYRAHAEIVRFTSQMFYDGQVEPAGKLLIAHPHLKPLTFFAVQGEESQDSQSTGYSHSLEAIELAERVAELKKTWPTEYWGPYGEGSIGVLAYYAEQVQRIRCELRKRRLFDVSVERVLNVQGKQFTAVFISTVRTRNCCRRSAETNIKDYGFLTNPRLLNTAVTRAKCLVAVVGDPVALLTIGSCRRLWEKYLEVASIHGIDQMTLQHHLSMVPELPSTMPLNPLAQEFVPRNQPVCMVEYVPVPVLYPIIHYSPKWTSR